MLIHCCIAHTTIYTIHFLNRGLLYYDYNIDFLSLFYYFSYKRKGPWLYINKLENIHNYATLITIRYGRSDLWTGIVILRVT